MELTKLEIKQLQHLNKKINHPRYHLRCPLVPRQKYYNPERNKGYYVKNLYCPTHNINCSRSGWEWRWYEGLWSTLIGY